MKPFFPYKFREFQEEFHNFIQLSISKARNIIVEAATGFGKTPLILSALIPEAIKKDLKILWIVKTGSESDRPIEELKAACRKLNTNIFGFSFRGKKDMCPLLKDLKLSNKVTHEEASLICETYKNKCKYKVNLERFNNFRWLIKEPRVYTEILNFCVKNKVCPYKIQVSLLDYARILALSYNYIIDSKINYFMRAKVGFKNSILIVDEAHNLQQAASELNSDKITIGSIERALKEAEAVKNRDLEWFLDAMIGYFQKFLKFMKSEDSLFQLNELIWKCAGDEDSFREFCEESKRIGNKLRRQRLLEEKLPRSSLHHLGEFWIKVMDNINVEGVALTASKESGSLTVEFTDMRASELFNKLWNEFNACIFCSGTLKPLDAFAEVIGVKNNCISKVFSSPYSERNLSAFIVKGVSTRGRELTDEVGKSYIKALNSFIKALNTNLAIFTSSYRVQNKLLKLGLKEEIEKYNREVFIEEQNIRGEESREIIKKFKACVNRDRKGVLIGVMGGRFAEGADFPGKQLEGIFLVGIPFEKPTVKTQLYIQYYNKIYGEKGKYYAYILPALKRASQALGRALRSKDDYATIVLGDERYNRYLELLPDYIQKTVKLVNFEALFNALLKA
ncbi:MAG: helicase C-terminal domain-containing protein [Candidatus Bathyarchaeia archaeon]